MRTIHNLEFPFREAVRSPAVTLGVFDGIHLGHQRVIRETMEEARKIAGHSLVITFDTHPEAVVKGSAPLFITSLDHRLLILDQLGVDFCLVLSFDEKWRNCSPKCFVKDLLVDRIGACSVVLGFNCTFGKSAQGNFSLLKRLADQYQFRAQSTEMVLDRGEVISSTAIRHAILKGDLEKASRMLGRPVSVLGTVVPGGARGRNLGFPTANLRLHHEARPPEGVYAARVILEGKPFGAVSSIGRRPTFYSGSHGGEVVVEVHIFDFRGDLYGKDIEVQFLEYRRSEKKFSSQEDLKKAIWEDVEGVKRSLKKYLTKKMDLL